MICVQLRQERHEALESRLMPLLTELGFSWNPVYRYAAPNGAFRLETCVGPRQCSKTEMRPLRGATTDYACARDSGAVGKKYMPKHLVPSKSGLNRRQFIYYSAALAAST